MKKTLLMALLVTLSISASAQIIRTQDLEKYAKDKYGDKWEEAAANLGKTLSLDKNDALTYTQIIDCGNKTKEQLYIIMNQWFAESFNDANSVIKLNDKESGTIIGVGYLSDIAGHMGGLIVTM